MRRMVHRNSNGFIEGTTTIYEEGEGPGIGETISAILYGLIALGGLYYCYKAFEPWLR